MVQIKSLKKSIGSFTLIVGSLEIKTPGIYGLIGPNGSGKSTFAKLIGGIIQPDEGELNISFDSRDITIIPQKPYIMDDTVYNNLAYPLKIRGIKNSKALCEDSLAKGSLIKYKNQQAHGLSGGEKQKLALLRAMIFKPRLIILDEAMTELDLDSQVFFEEMVLERQKQDPVVWIIISHQLKRIKLLCNYIFFLSHGHLEAEGTINELFASDNPAVKQYLKHEYIGVLP